MVRVYQAGQYNVGAVVELSASASHHVATVLRRKEGDYLHLFPGDNCTYLAKIIKLQKKTVILMIENKTYDNRESPCQIDLAQSLSKGERMEWVVQKAVELGVSNIYPIITARSVVRPDADRLEKKQVQWQKIAISACEQCGRNVIPMIHQPCSLEQYLQQCIAALKLVLSPSAQLHWREITWSSHHIALLIGPEGGLDNDELSLLISKGFQALSLGPRVLRTETAALTAMSLLQAVRGDL